MIWLRRISLISAASRASASARSMAASSALICGKQAYASGKREKVADAQQTEVLTRSFARRRSSHSLLSSMRLSDGNAKGLTSSGCFCCRLAFFLEAWLPCVFCKPEAGASGCSALLPFFEAVSSRSCQVRNRSWKEACSLPTDIKVKGCGCVGCAFAAGSTG